MTLSACSIAAAPIVDSTGGAAMITCSYSLRKRSMSSAVVFTPHWSGPVAHGLNVGTSGSLSPPCSYPDKTCFVAVMTLMRARSRALVLLLSGSCVSSAPPGLCSLADALGASG